MEEITGYGTMKPRNIISSILGQTPIKPKSLAISNPHDFRTVGSVYLFFAPSLKVSIECRTVTTFTNCKS